jgi:probable F420-dependent oxidoreductase
MEIGIAIFPTVDTPSPADIGRIVEERGYDVLYFPEHTHIPASRETPYPAGGDLPSMYWSMLDQFVACTAAAAVTTRLRVATGVCLVAQHHPITLAKQVASLDVVSGGRFDFGVGAGWNREEMRNHGTDPVTRMRNVRERIEAMQAIWREQEASYAGEFVRFDAIWSEPKPVQKPWPPIHVGGNGPTVEDRVLAFGDGWMPNAFGPDDEHLLERAHVLRARAERPLALAINNASTRPERLARLAEAGVDRVIFFLPQGRDGVLEQRFERIESGLQGAGLR